MEPEAGESTPLVGEETSEVLCLRLPRKKASLIKTICGYLLIVTAGILFTVANVIQKIVAPELVFWHLLVYRAFVQIAVTYAELKWRGVSPLGPREHRWRIVTQGLLGGFLLLCLFIAIKHVPLGSASAIFFCTPVFTFVFAVTMLKERLGAYRVLISALMIGGVLLITRPPFIFPPDFVPSHHDGNGTQQHQGQGDESEAFSTMGYMCAIAVPLFSAIVSIMCRQLKEVRPSVLMLWFGVGALIVSVGGIIAFKAGGYFSYTPLQYVYILAITSLGLIGNMSYTLAVRFVSPSKGNVFRSFEVILNYVLQLQLEHSIFHSSSIVGIMLLLSAVVFTGFETEMMTRFSQRFKFL